MQILIKKNKDNQTPLFNACRSGNKNLVKYLVEPRTSIDIEDRYGETPLFDACASGNKDLIKYLIEER